MENIQLDKHIGTNVIMLLAIILFVQILTTIGITVPSQLIPAASAVVKAGNITSVDIKAGSGLSSTMPLHPSILYLHKGDTVKWINNDNVNHSITSLLFNSGILLPKASGHGPSTFSYTFNQDGTVAYVDSLHPFLGGVIYVDVPTTQRELISTTMPFINVKVEMPQNAAYKNNYGAFFVPASIQVPVGTKVTWSNKDYVAHTATSADGSTFDTKTILPGTSLTLTLQHKGIFPYYCKIHPWMMGTILVS
jgi:plastocyanin